MALEGPSLSVGLSDMLACSGVEEAVQVTRKTFSGSLICIMEYKHSVIGRLLSPTNDPSRTPNPPCSVAQTLP